jgi:hypothetical protein
MPEMAATRTPALDQPDRRNALAVECVQLAGQATEVSRSGAAL